MDKVRIKARKVARWHIKVDCVSSRGEVMCCLVTETQLHHLNALVLDEMMYLKPISAWVVKTPHGLLRVPWNNELNTPSALKSLEVLL